MNAKKRMVHRLFPGELEMVQMLWRMGSVTILEAQKGLGLPIGYTTVQTRLNRLVAKGVASRSRTRPAKYSAAITPDDIRRGDLDLLVDRVSEGQVVPLVAHLLRRNKISQEELDEVRRLIDQAERSLERSGKRQKP